MTDMTRRGVLGAAAAALAAPAVLRAAGPGRVAVVGAGAFGAWTAWKLLERGHRVLLIDAWGPAHARASSGGESRMTRSAYGPDEVYARMALDSLADWKWLSARSDLPLFHQIGVLFFFQKLEPYFEDSLAVHRRMGLPTQLLDAPALRRRFPQIDFTGVEAGLYEPGFGALMARRAIQSLVARFTQAGGVYRQARVAGLAPEGLRLADGETVSADQHVFACGPWLPKLFPDLLGRRIFPTRQEVFFFATPPGEDAYAPGRLPGWADFNEGDIYYGFPDLEARGFKIAHDRHGPPVDPDTLERLPSADALADVRAFMARRFPGLAEAPLSEARVCQYENSANGDLLIDRHPDRADILLVGAGSGHGFKHGPAVGAYAADLIEGKRERPEPRFSLATKTEAAARAVH
ncbi:MAG: FAD-dependent oxidoreductase [Allosphingosinicella sp.]|uniref:FAD-dependent oxidoreductase n=1 Tax=Allosphingosinicella sp. TaxID=2823234 RepID=UPI00394224BF